MYQSKKEKKLNKYELMDKTSLKYHSFCPLHYKFSIIVLLILFACNSKEITDIPKSVKPKLCSSYSIQDNCYHDIFLIHDSLLVLISNCDTMFFSIYNERAKNLILKFGKKGKGPNDFNFPFPFQTNSLTHQDSHEYLFYDLNKPELYKINFETLISTNDLSKSMKSEIINSELFGPSQLNKIGKSNIAGTDNDNPNGLFFIFNEATKKKKWIKYPTDLEVDIDSRYFTSLYYGSLTSNSKTIVFGYHYFDIIAFYNDSGGLIQKYCFSDYPEPIISKAYIGIDPHSRLYFTKSFSTANYCYFQRENKTVSSLRDSSNTPSKILVFNWAGNITNSFEFKNSAFCFCVSNNEKELYRVENDTINDGFVTINKYLIK